MLKFNTVIILCWATKYLRMQITEIRIRWKYNNVIHDIYCVLYLLLVYIAAYDLYARLGLANSERIACQTTSDTFINKNI